MFPRPVERRELPDAVRELEGHAQFWDDERALSRELKARILPGYPGDVPWDLFALFDAEATWASAGEHVIAWGGPVEHELDRLTSALRAPRE
jgi:hypothetical protein